MSLIHGAMQSYALTLDKFLDHGARWHPEAEVVTASEDGPADRIGYAELRQRCGRLSAVLDELGVRQGQCVATLAWNTRAHVEAWFAITGMGAVCHTLNPRLSDQHLVDMLKQSEANVLVVSADLAPLASRLAKRCDRVERILVIDGQVSGRAEDDSSTMMIPLEPMIGRSARSFPWGGFDENLPSGLCFTSGTTDAPKGVTYTHRSSFLHTLRIMQADTMAISTTDRVLLAVPLFHANGWGVPLATAATGAGLILPGRHLDGARLADLINAESVTLAVGIATVWLTLLKHLEATNGEIPSLKRIIVGGAAMAPGLMKRIERRLGVTVQTSWGMTELSPSGTLDPPDNPDRQAQRSGRPALGIDLLLTNAGGDPLPQQRDAEGHLHVRGSSAIERYFGETTPAVNRQGWFDTGDLARIDSDGYLVITGRSKDLIKSGGEWINPAEIETIVGELPQVSQVAVIGQDHPKWGERPLLLVELHEDYEIRDAELVDRLEGRVPDWWLPDTIIRLDRMPLNSTGKVDKNALRARFGGEREQLGA